MFWLDACLIGSVIIKKFLKGHKKKIFLTLALVMFSAVQ